MIRLFLLVGLALVVLAVAVLLLWRWSDLRADKAEMDRLVRLQPGEPDRFDPAIVAGLPDPARRFFTFTIRPDTPLRTVAEIKMVGQFSLGTKDAPGYQPMVARQVLAAPEGFVWEMTTTGGMPVSGSDSGTWTRFWLGSILPVARMGSDADHMRSAFGRYVSEAVFWTPAALLPGPGINWTQVDQTTARVTIRKGDLEQTVDVIVAEDGRPERVEFMRWSDANSEKTHRLQPFGGFLSDFRDVEGFMLPFRVEAGNMFGTDDYFPFFIADVTSIRFPAPPAERTASH